MLAQLFKQSFLPVFPLSMGKLFKQFFPCGFPLSKILLYKQFILCDLPIAKVQLYKQFLPGAFPRLFGQGLYHILLLGVFLFLGLSLAKAQPYSTVTLIDKPFTPPVSKNQGLIKKLEQNAVYNASSSIEKDFIYWTNYSRLFPQAFCDSVLIPFTNSQPSTKGKYAQSLIADLNKVQALPLLLPIDILTDAAKRHSKDLVYNKGRITHQSSDGTSFAQRMKRAGVNTCAAENLSMGHEDPLISLLLLYLDIGLPDAGHRLNLMNPAFTQMGVSVRQIPENQYITVQEFACSPR